MHFPSDPFTLTCPHCGEGTLKLDDSAFDQSCQGKHVFLFECDQCGKYTATAMENIPVQEWEKFIPAEHLDKMISDYHAAQKKG